MSVTQLSLDKFQQFIEAHAYLLQRVYTLHGRCHFIEVIHTMSALRLLIQIPNTYDCIIHPSLHTVQLDPSTVPGNGDNADDFAEASDRIIESAYRDVDVHLRLPGSGNSRTRLTDHLGDTYRRTVVTEKVVIQDRLRAKDITRQIHRLKFSIQGLGHRVALIQYPWMAILTSSDRVALFHASRLPKSDDVRHLLVIVDLDRFYDTIDHTASECHEILNGVYDIIATSQKTHTRNLTQLMNRRDQVLERTAKLETIRTDYASLLSDYKGQLAQLHGCLVRAREELTILRKQEPDTMHAELRHSHRIQIIEKKVEKMERTREELLKATAEVGSAYDQLTLHTDSIFFDSIVMLDKIQHHFDELEQMERSFK